MPKSVFTHCISQHSAERMTKRWIISYIKKYIYSNTAALDSCSCLFYHRCWLFCMSQIIHCFFYECFCVIVLNLIQFGLNFRWAHLAFRWQTVIQYPCQNTLNEERQRRTSSVYFWSPLALFQRQDRLKCCFGVCVCVWTCYSSCLLLQLQLV